MSSQLFHQSSTNAGITANFQHVKDTLLKGIANSSPPTILFLPLFLYPVINKVFRKVRDDYELFLSLGPGGTPSTPLGYLKVSILRVLIANRHVLTPPKHDSVTDQPGPYFQSILDLAPRKGVRPTLAGIAPQRQISQRSNDLQIAALQAYLRSVAAANTDVLETGLSCFEKQSLALFLKDRPNKHCRGDGLREVPPETNLNCSDLQATLGADADGLGPINSTCGLPPEVAHMHGSEGSLHLTLHPEDAAVVIQRGWGERHPLAGAGGLMRDVFSGKGMKALYGTGPSEGWLPKGFMMVYAPRNEEERKIVGKIVRAGAWWVGGIKLRESSEF